MSTSTASKRHQMIAAIDKRLGAPSASDLKALQQHGSETWGEYIHDQADNAGVSVSEAYSIFQMLGESEAFDGFVTSLEDAAMMNGDEE